LNDLEPKQADFTIKIEHKTTRTSYSAEYSSQIPNNQILHVKNQPLFQSFMSQISSLLQSLSPNLPQSTLYRIHQAKYDHENYASENSLICELQTVFAKNENFEPNRQAALIEAVSKLKKLPIANRAGLVYFLRCLSEKNIKGDNKLKNMNNSGNNNNNSGNRMSSFGDFNSTAGTNNSVTNNTQIHVPGLQLGTSSSMQKLNFSDSSSQVSNLG